mgnify:CR=1 FL=1
MIYLFTALYCEAHPLIREFGLVRNPKNTWLQEFDNEEAGIRLTITGVGEIAAAAAVGSVCGGYPPAQADILLNVGICARGEGAEGIFLCNQITEQTTGRTFYPDMLYRHDFHEASIVTGTAVWNRAEDGSDSGPCGRQSVSPGALYDMEAAAIYQAGSLFFGPHQMMFLKVVSDRGAAGEVSGERTERLMEQYREPMADYIRQIRRITGENVREDSRRQKEEALVEQLGTDLHCSKAMKDCLRQYIRYLTLNDCDYMFVIKEMYENGLIPCKDKREGKLCFEELKRRVL